MGEKIKVSFAGILTILTIAMLSGTTFAMIKYEVKSVPKLEDAIVPVQDGWPLAFDVTDEQKNIPPMSLKYPQNPVFIPTLPGLVSGKVTKSDLGHSIPKYDSILIIQSKVEDGKVVIPPGGLIYSADTLRGTLPVMGFTELILGEEYFYVDYDSVIVAKSNVELPIGPKGSIVVGDQVYTYWSAPIHETLANPTVYITTKNYVDWAFAGMSPGILSEGPAVPLGAPGGKKNWYGSPQYARLPEGKQAFLMDLHQGFAWSKDITRTKIKFTTLTGVDTWYWKFCKTRSFFGLAEEGKSIAAGGYTVNVAKIYPAAKTVHVQLLKDGKVVKEKTLGPVTDETYYRLAEDKEQREKTMLHAENIAVQFFIWPKAIEDGKARIAVYTDCKDVEDGKPSPWDERFLMDSIVCPQGHGFGEMFYNKDEIVLTKEKNAYNGPAGYFKVVVDDVTGKVAKWHIEDKTGEKSLVFEKEGNIDTIVGNGRGNQGLMGTWTPGAAQAEMYKQMQRLNAELQKARTQAPATPAPEKKGICGPTAVMLLAAIPVLVYAARNKN